MRWSISAHHSSRRCERQVFYSQVYASHAATDPARREAYVLKQLQNQRAWQGNVIHHVLATTAVEELRRGRTMLDVDELCAAAHGIASRQLAFSVSGRYKDSSKSRNPDFAALFFHEYGLELDYDPVASVVDVARECFSFLVSEGSALLDSIAAASAIYTERAITTSIAGVSVVAQPDVIAVYPRGRCTIVDWKIVASPTAYHVSQLLVYGLVVLRSPSVPVRTASDLNLVEANLLSRQVTSEQATDGGLQTAEDFIYRSAAQLSGITRSDGVSLEEHLADLDIAKSAGTCRMCNFRRICGEALASAPEEPVLAIQGALL